MGLKRMMTGLACAAALLGGCSTVATQTVPVSSVPVGAQVLADGKAACLTPCDVVLEKTRDHILVLLKDGYLQQDVVLRRQYQTEKALVGAINSGMNTGTFLNNPAMGVQSGLGSLQHQERSGEAYLLLPSAVSVRLTPRLGLPASSGPAQADQALAQSLPQDASPLELMDRNDESHLENVLETSRSGQSHVWENRASGLAFAVVPEPAESGEAQVVRWFSLAASRGDRKLAGRYPAFRVGRGEWQVGLPPDQGQGADQPQARPVDPGRVAVRALGESTAPAYRKDWSLGSTGSSRTSTTVTPLPGGQQTTTTTTSSKTTIKAGVNVTPQSVMQALDALGGLGQ